MEQDDQHQPEAESLQEESMDVDQNPPAKAPRERRPKEATTLTHIPGKSVFPVSRVQRILKADKELPMVSREAVMLISLATEEFIRRLSEASHRLAVRDNRATVQRKDIASVCRRADEFFFLEELIPLYEPESVAAAKRKPKGQQAKDRDVLPGNNTTLDGFVSKTKEVVGDEEEGRDISEDIGDDVVMNADGTMTLDSL